MPDLSEWVGQGGIIAAFVAVAGVALVVQRDRATVRAEREKLKTERARLRVTIEGERSKNRVEARRVAVEESTAAVEVIGAAMRIQDERITAQDTHIAALNQRMADLDQRHVLAIAHIAEREAWTGRRWSRRPETLPAIPVVLIPDVAAADPSLCLQVPDDPEEPPRPRRPPPQE